MRLATRSIAAASIFTISIIVDLPLTVAALCQACGSSAASDGPCQSDDGTECFPFLAGTSDCPANTSRCEVLPENGEFNCEGDRVCEGLILECTNNADCHVNCIGVAACFQAIIVCPSGTSEQSEFECDIDCHGEEACAEARIRAGVNQQNARLEVSAIGSESLRDAEVRCDGTCTVICDDDRMPCQNTNVLCDEESVCKLDCQQDNSCPGAEIDCPAPDSDAAADVGALTPQCILGCGSEGACRPQLIEASDDGYDTTAGEDYYTEGVTVIDFTRQAYLCETYNDSFCPQDLGAQDACGNDTPWRCGGMDTLCVADPTQCETQPVTSNQGGSAYTSSRFAPPSKSVLGQVGSFVWLIGIALVVALAGVLYIASVLMADRAEVRGANHGRILLVGLAIADVISDVGFAFMLFAIGDTTFGALSTLFLVIPVTLNAVLLTTILVEEFRRPEFSSWFAANSTKVTIILVFAVTYIDTLPILFAEGIFGRKRGKNPQNEPPNSMFWGPFSVESRRRLQWFGIVGNLFEDFPQLCLQMMFAVQKADDIDPIFIIAILTSALALASGVSRRLCLVLMRRLAPSEGAGDCASSSASMGGEGANSGGRKPRGIEHQCSNPNFDHIEPTQKSSGSRVVLGSSLSRSNTIGSGDARHNGYPYNVHRLSNASSAGSSTSFLGSGGRAASSTATFDRIETTQKSPCARVVLGSSLSDRIDTVEKRPAAADIGRGSGRQQRRPHLLLGTPTDTLSDSYSRSHSYSRDHDDDYSHCSRVASSSVSARSNSQQQQQPQYQLQIQYPPRDGRSAAGGAVDTSSGGAVGAARAASILPPPYRNPSISQSSASSPPPYRSFNPERPYLQSGFRAQNAPKRASRFRYSDQ